MKSSKSLSHVTKDYLTTYYCILDAMIHNMTTARLTDSISYNFMSQMIPHHQAAIEMSRNLLKYTTFIPLQNIAEQIIAEQTASIENMQKIMCTCESMRNTPNDLQVYRHNTNEIMQTMFSDMVNARSTNQLNANFMREMIPHHEGAVKMSNNTLSFPICPQLRPILNAIITSQEKGIQQMQHLLCRISC